MYRSGYNQIFIITYFPIKVRALNNAVRNKTERMKSVEWIRGGGGMRQTRFDLNSSCQE